MRLDQFFEWSVRETPAAEFARQGLRRISFAEAGATVGKMAAALLAAGLGPGDRFAYLSKNSIEFVLAYLAASRSGTVIVPLNYRHTAPEWATILADSAARLVVARGPVVASIDGLRETLPDVTEWVALEHPAPDGWRSHDAWLAATSAAAPDPGPTEELCQMYTSGTTGRPKGAILTHRSVTTNAWQIAITIPRLPSRGEPALIVMPVFHAGAAGQLFGGIVFGASFVIHEEFDPGAVVQSLADDRIATSSLVPAMIRACLTVAEAGPPRSYDSLRALYYGASPIDSGTLRRALTAFRCPLVQAYGMTETSTVISVLSAADHERALAGQPELLLSAGRPIPGTEVMVVDEDGRPVPVGTAGQILARGPQVMKGYWRRPDDTAKALAGGWMHTGDVGCFDAAGYLYLLDRLNDTINTGGENVYPREVEEVLLAHPAVADAAVVGVPDDRWGEAVLAVVVRRTDATVSDRDLTAHCRDRIAGYKVPRRIEFVDSLPRTATGKVLRRELREPYWKGRVRRVG